MKQIICDLCKQTVPRYTHVFLDGVGYHSKNSGIMLPQGAMSNDFCSPDCFWKWTKDQLFKAKEVTSI